MRLALTCEWPLKISILNDNVFDSSTSIGSVIVSDFHTSLNIGKHYDYAFDGLIDEIRINDRVLSRNEIRDLYHG